MDVKLVVVGGDAKPTEIKLKLPATLGRGRDVTISLPQSLVSRSHCQIIESEDGKLWVRDLGSLNGTFVGSERITEAELPPGELLTIGTVTFRAIYGEFAEQFEGEGFSGAPTQTVGQTVDLQNDKTVVEERAANDDPAWIEQLENEIEAVGEMAAADEEGTDVKKQESVGTSNREDTTMEANADDEALRDFLEGLKD